MKKIKSTHESISASMIGRWALPAAVLVDARIFGQFIKCHLQRSEFDIYLNEKQKQIPFINLKISLSGVDRAIETSCAITSIAHTNMVIKPFCAAGPFISIMLNILFCFVVCCVKREWPISIPTARHHSIACM